MPEWQNFVFSGVDFRLFVVAAGWRGTPVNNWNSIIDDLSAYFPYLVASGGAGDTNEFHLHATDTISVSIPTNAAPLTQTGLPFTAYVFPLEAPAAEITIDAFLSPQPTLKKLIVSMNPTADAPASPLDLLIAKKGLLVVAQNCVARSMEITVPEDGAPARINFAFVSNCIGWMADESIDLTPKQAPLSHFVHNFSSIVSFDVSQQFPQHELVEFSGRILRFTMRAARSVDLHYTLTYLPRDQISAMAARAARFYAIGAATLEGSMRVIVPPLIQNTFPFLPAAALTVALQTPTMDYPLLTLTLNAAFSNWSFRTSVREGVIADVAWQGFPSATVPLWNVDFAPEWGT